MTRQAENAFIFLDHSSARFVFPCRVVTKLAFDPDPNYVANCRYQIISCPRQILNFSEIFPTFCPSDCNYCRLTTAVSKLFIIAAKYYQTKTLKLMYRLEFIVLLILVRV